MDWYHSSVLLNSGSMSKITPRNGNSRCRTTWPSLNLAMRVLLMSMRIIQDRGPRQCCVSGGSIRFGGASKEHVKGSRVGAAILKPIAGAHVRVLGGHQAREVEHD